MIEEEPTPSSAACRTTSTEFAVHRYDHINFRKISQAEHNLAVRARSRGVPAGRMWPATGFRCPYLVSRQALRDLARGSLLLQQQPGRRVARGSASTRTTPCSRSWRTGYTTVNADEECIAPERVQPAHRNCRTPSRTTSSSSTASRSADRAYSPRRSTSCARFIDVRSCSRRSSIGVVLHLSARRPARRCSPATTHQSR